MTELHHFTKVEFFRFKALKQFTLHLGRFNILVGPNNAGKSTILAAFRILAAAIRRATSRKAEWVRGPVTDGYGYHIDIASISVAEENIFFNYDDSEGAKVVFYLTNKNTLTLYFPTGGGCRLMLDAEGKLVQTPKAFKANFNCPVGFVPILGPVEHYEALYEKDAARNALFNYGASRNFRNIWYHYPERFEEFRDTLRQTWPGMDVDRPGLDYSGGKSRLYMFCPEHRLPRELFWAGFGFQVWCQMLTHLIQSREKAIFLIDEPDIYLHSDLQRQLIALLRELGPDILIATHSTEIITEAETDDIVVVSKVHKHSRRIRNPAELHGVLRSLGSTMNPILTQLAKTRRVLFVEGKDFSVIGRFARRFGNLSVGNQRDFAVVPVEGFSPERIRSLKKGMEMTLGVKVVAAAILDRDYRPDSECAKVVEECGSFCSLVHIHTRKEIENFLLVPTALDRALSQRVSERARRSGVEVLYDGNAQTFLRDYAAGRKSYVTAQLLAAERQYRRSRSEQIHDAVLNQQAIEALEAKWAKSDGALSAISGKEALSALNAFAQEKWGASVTPAAIVDAMRLEEVPDEIRILVSLLERFISEPVTTMPE